MRISGKGGGKNTYFEILLSATVAPWNSPVSGSRKRGILALSAVCPGTMVAGRKNPITLKSVRREGVGMGDREPERNVL